MSKVHYFPPNTTADFSFWEKLYDIKLNKYGLSGNTTDEKISSYYSQNEIKLTNSSFNTQNFDQTTSSSSDRFYSHGFLRNVNTINEFITLDKTQYLSQFGKKIWNEMITNEVVEDPSLFNQFVLLTFADLKNYKFTHWFGYPTIVPENPFLSYSDPIPLAAPLENQNIFLENSSPLFGLLQSHEGYIPLSFKESLEHHHTSNNLIFVINYTPKSQNQVSSSSPSDQIQCPWHIRNILAYFALKGVGYEVTNPNGKVVKLIFNSSSSNNVDISPIYSIFLPSMSFSQEESVLPKVIGWQPNDRFNHHLSSHLMTSSSPPPSPPSSLPFRGKPGPNILDASSVMNTQHIMEQAVDLNVRLMKWRLWPNLNTELLSNTKCLLLGAGTLGCAVARTLMGWGVRDITFLDNGRVSYSNPARQSLFEYEDCVTKSFKAKAAAERLLKIFPGMRSHGEVLSIPMPGHAIPPADQDSFVSNVHRLDQLIKDHDVIFALTDSREARWLPTVMCSAHDKLLINAALGFDTYLVMRHGHSVVHSNSTNRLGCYFCMDVTAPGNSQRDRTLDQQCTVTRPGLAQIASGLAVELMVSLLHSPLRQQTQAAPKDGKHNEDEDKEDEENEENDSYLPHQIRGFLSTFLQVQPRCSSFPHCTACSEVVVRSLYPDPVNTTINLELLERICQDSSILEELSGVSQLTAGLDDIDLLEEEEEGDGEGMEKSDL